MRILIKNGHLIDPGNKIDGKYNLLVEDGRISKLTKDSIETDAEIKVFDAEGKYILPGFVDLHVHFREPGFEYKETIKTGSLAAAAGGFTTVCMMPNTKPALDTPEMIDASYDKAKKEAVIKVLPIGAITKGQNGKELVDIKGMAEHGAVAISEDGKSVMASDLAYEALMRAKEVNMPVFAHCEDITLVKGGVMNKGKRAEELGLPGISNAVEEIIEARDVLLAGDTGAQLHLCHC
nr:amidohydrolase family protein [Lachnospiraceae bacterium]